jgi:hypothetical protein
MICSFTKHKMKEALCEEEDRTRVELPSTRIPTKKHTFRSNGSSRCNGLPRFHTQIPCRRLDVSQYAKQSPPPPPVQADRDRRTLTCGVLGVSPTNTNLFIIYTVRHGEIGTA